MRKLLIPIMAAALMACDVPDGVWTYEGPSQPAGSYTPEPAIPLQLTINAPDNVETGELSQFSASADDTDAYYVWRINSTPADSNLNDELAIQISSQLNTENIVRDIATHGNTLYAGINEGGLAIIELDDAGQINLTSSISVAGVYGYGGKATIYGVGTSGDITALAGWRDGTYLLDTSNHDAPVILNHIELEDNFINDAAVEGTTLYLLDTYKGITALDISDPLSPIEISNQPIPSCQGKTIEKHGDIITVGCFNFLVYEFDYSSPANPSRITTHKTSNTGPLFGFDIHNNILYGAEMHAGLGIYDLTQPFGYELIDIIKQPDDARDAKIYEGKLYVAMYKNGGIQAFGIEDELSPDLQDIHRDGKHHNGLLVHNSRLFSYGGIPRSALMIDPEKSGFKSEDNIATVSSANNDPTNDGYGFIEVVTPAKKPQHLGRDFEFTPDIAGLYVLESIACHAKRGCTSTLIFINAD